jgi:hypothetical protein
MKYILATLVKVVAVQLVQDMVGLSVLRVADNEWRYDFVPD